MVCGRFSPTMRTLIFVCLGIGVSAARIQNATQKFHDLGKQMKKVTNRWRKHDQAFHAARIPAHIRNRSTAEVLEVIPVSHLGGCGAKISARKLGLKKSPQAAKMWGKPSLLEIQSKLRGKAPEHPGRESFSVPGAGATQTPADNGRSTTGSVGGEEPFVTVLKDGYFQVGCFHDRMLHHGDKFGNDADKYKMDSADVSIALYSELVLDEDKVAMTPTACFEFCRTLPDMGFFGIADGRTCYCTPYYHPQPGDEEQCNAPCEGDTTVMCGNMKGKSSIFEMHLCDSTATDLENALTPSKQALDYFFETALLAQNLGEKMAASGLALEKVAGLSGAPGAADMGMSAKVKSKDLTQAFMAASDSYEKLLAAYKLGKGQEGKDFTSSTELVVADKAIKGMKSHTGAVVSGAAATHETLKLAYPVVDQVTFGNEPDGKDAAAMKLKGLVDGDEQAEADFRVASYAYDKTYDAKQASCKGPVIGLPIVGLGQTGCALACEATVYPDQCVGYSFYTLTGEDDLCFMLMEIETVETFSCPAPALLQKGKEAAEPDSASAFCGIKMSLLTTGYKPMQGNGQWKKTDRCFGKDTGIALKQEMEEYSVPSDSKLTLGAVELEKA